MIKTDVALNENNLAYRDLENAGMQALIDADRGAAAQPVPQPRLVGARSVDVDDAGLERSRDLVVRE